MTDTPDMDRKQASNNLLLLNLCNNDMAKKLQ